MAFEYLETHFGKSSLEIVNAVECTIKKVNKEGIKVSFDEVTKIVEKKFSEAKLSYPIKLWKEKWAQGIPFIRQPVKYEEEEVYIIEENERVTLYYHNDYEEYKLHIKLNTVSPQINAQDGFDTCLDITISENVINLAIHIRIGKWEYDVETFSREDIITEKSSERMLKIIRFAGLFDYWKGKETREIIVTLKNAMSVIVLSADLNSL